MRWRVHLALGALPPLLKPPPVVASLLLLVPPKPPPVVVVGVVLVRGRLLGTLRRGGRPPKPPRLRLGGKIQTVGVDKLIELTFRP